MFAIEQKVEKIVTPVAGCASSERAEALHQWILATRNALHLW
jgi:hypothetical protein